MAHVELLPTTPAASGPDLPPSGIPVPPVAAGSDAPQSPPHLDPASAPPAAVPPAAAAAVGAAALTPTSPSAAGPAGPPTAGTAVLLSDGDGLSVALALRQRFQKTEPRYASSFGAVAFERSSKSGLKLTGWRVIETAQRTWRKLEAPLASLVHEKRGDWERARPRLQPAEQQQPGPYMPGYILRCFLLGPDKEHATPHVAIVCGAHWFRKAVGRIFTKSCLLVPDGFRCFGLPDRPELYMASSAAGYASFEARAGSEVVPQDASSVFLGEETMPANPGADADAASALLTRDFGRPTIAPRQLARLSEFEVRSRADYEDINGVGIEILRGGAVVGKAAVGGVVHLADSCLAMTVRHAFQGPANAAPSPLGADDGDDDSSGSELDLFEDDDDDEYANEQPDAATAASIDDGQRVSPAGALEHWDTAPAESSLIPQTLDVVGLQSGVLGVPEAKLDWALLPISDVNREFTAPRRGASRDGIVLKTPSGLRYGTADASGVLGIPVATQPQPVIVASIADVQPGECGSWAMRVRDGTMSGMLVGSCPTLGEVYLLRMIDILRDIRRHTGIEPRIGEVISTRLHDGRLPARGAGNWQPQYV
ncbi:armadillo-type protein [Purpureocillium lavendulum]|uniref:Armadillo-type protein n=1 Tax=Purpureocillium lavendulum TaxID=1247861 RepID=A0AB34FTW1_9HYPO|nr:armadillo-type protein [Purpureocillium lavendulum]